MGLISTIKSLIPKLSELQKLQHEYTRLCNKTVWLKKQGKDPRLVEAECDRVRRRMSAIHRMRREEKAEDYSFYDQTIKELDEEFPIARDLAQSSVDQDFDYY